MKTKRYPDWKGKIEKRWRWARFKFEWGRWCYNINCLEQTIKMWWEWENP